MLSVIPSETSSIEKAALDILIRRTVAFTFDTIFLAALYYLHEGPHAMLAFTILFGLLMSFVFGYRSPGKYLTGIRVTDPRRLPLEGREALERLLLKGLGFLLIYWTMTTTFASPIREPASEAVLLNWLGRIFGGGGWMLLIFEGMVRNALPHDLLIRSTIIREA